MFRFARAVLAPYRARLLVAVATVVIAGCQTAPSQVVAPPPVQAPLPTHVFSLADDADNVVGRLQVTRAHAEDTLSDIARRFNLGYEEIVRANPGVDPWLPREGTPIVLPTQFVLPDAPREGLVINLPALRLYYYPPRKKGEPQTVITHPIGIGMVGWSTPVGVTKVTRKRKDPPWYPPASVRREHAEEGDILPTRVPPGPDNPLGRYALNLEWSSYLIHGTNQPYGIGVRASHGCIRMYPEDIEQLYDDIPVGTRVTVVNQTLVYGHHRSVQYLQSYPAQEDYPTGQSAAPRQSAKGKPVAKAGAAAKAKRGKVAAKAEIEPIEPKLQPITAPLPNASPLVAELIKDPRGIAVPVSLPDMNLEKFFASATPVENRVPDNATWNGIE